MKSVFKYEIPILDSSAIMMHDGAIIRHVDNQHERLCIWAEVDPQNAMSSRTFYVRGTGHELPPNVEYIGTAIFASGALVFHVYQDVAF